MLINGASGSVGSAAVQLAVARGARVIGPGVPPTHDYLRSLGAEPVAYGEAWRSGSVRSRPGRRPGARRRRERRPARARRTRGRRRSTSSRSPTSRRARTACGSAGATPAARSTRSPRSATWSGPGGSRSPSGRHSRWPTSRRHTASAKEVTSAESSCCWSTERHPSAAGTQDCRSARGTFRGLDRRAARADPDTSRRIVNAVSTHDREVTMSPDAPPTGSAPAGSWESARGRRPCCARRTRRCESMDGPSSS